MLPSPHDYQDSEDLQNSDQVGDGCYGPKVVEESYFLCCGMLVCPNRRRVKGYVVLPKAACRHIIAMCEEFTTPPAVLYAALPRLLLALLRLVLLEAQSCSGGVAFAILFASAYILISQQKLCLIR